MTDIQTSEFFAPANTNLLDGLVAEYRHKLRLLGNNLKNTSWLKMS